MAYQTVTTRPMEQFDVLIVGGGIAGASLGARLARDRKVVLVEAETLCGRHATGRSAAFWQASLGGDIPERRLSLASKPMFDTGWPGSETPLLRKRGAIHLVSAADQRVEEADELTGDDAPVRIDRDELDRLIPGLKGHWTGAWYEASCSDIEVAAFHAACLAAMRRLGGMVRTDAALLSARRGRESWQVETSGGRIEAAKLVNAAGAWGDDVAKRAGVPGLCLEPRRRTVVQLRVGRR